MKVLTALSDHGISLFLFEVGLDRVAEEVVGESPLDGSRIFVRPLLLLLLLPPLLLPPIGRLVLLDRGLSGLTFFVKFGEQFASGFFADPRRGVVDPGVRVTLIREVSFDFVDPLCEDAELCGAVSPLLLLLLLAVV